MMRHRWPASFGILFLILWAAFLIVGRTGFFQDPGTFWHTRVGDIILKEGFFTTDPFTFTFAQADWIPHQWLGEVVMALAYRLGGWDTLLLLAASTLAACYAWPAARLLQTGLHPAMAALIIFTAVAAGASHFHIRPHLATIAGLTITLMLLSDCETNRMTLRRLFWLVPVYLIWSNCHGGMLGGLATLALTSLGWCLAWIIGWPSPIKSLRDVGRLLFLGLACAATAFINPYGIALPRTWLAIMDSPILPQIIAEHAPLRLQDPSAWPIILFTGLYLFVLAGTIGKPPRITWLIPLFWMFQAYARVRHAPLFALSGLIGIASMWPFTRWADWLARHRPDWQRPVLPATDQQLSFRERLLGFTAPAWLPTAAIGLMLALQVLGLRGWAKLDEKKWPVELLPVLIEHEPRASQRNHLFNDYIDGGFVIFHAPAYRVFVDDRCELFGDAWLVEFLNAASTDTASAIQHWQERYGPFHFALTRLGTSFDDCFAKDPEWQCLYRGKIAAFYQRR